MAVHFYNEHVLLKTLQIFLTGANHHMLNQVQLCRLSACSCGPKHSLRDASVMQSAFITATWKLSSLDCQGLEHGCTWTGIITSCLAEMNTVHETNLTLHMGILDGE